MESEKKLDATNRDDVLKTIETTHPPAYVQALKDFLEKKITYEQMQKICAEAKKTAPRTSD